MSVSPSQSKSSTVTLRVCVMGLCPAMAQRKLQLTGKEAVVKRGCPLLSSFAVEPFLSAKHPLLTSSLNVTAVIFKPGTFWRQDLTM